MLHNIKVLYEISAIVKEWSVLLISNFVSFWWFVDVLKVKFDDVVICVVHVWMSWSITGFTLIPKNILKTVELGGRFLMLSTVFAADDMSAFWPEFT